MDRETIGQIDIRTNVPMDRQTIGKTDKWKEGAEGATNIGTDRHFRQQTV